MIIVLDTNVIIASFASEGLCHALFELCVDQHEIYISNHILEEMVDGFHKKLKLPQKTVTEIIEYIKEIATLRNPPNIDKRTCRDIEDDKILSLAVDSNANYLISGDKDLLILKKYKDIPIITPREFWEILRNKK